MIYFTSDTHYFHTNVIKYSNRPFKDADEMNKEMIKRWNEVVTQNDEVYHLGDFGFSSKEKLTDIANQLICKRKYIIRGNHDKKLPDGFIRIEQCSEVYVANKVKVVLCHYAMRTWNKAHHGSYMFYGHSHGTLPGNSQSLDVGVDCWNYYPVTFEQIQKRLEQSPKWFPVDHHSK